MSQIFHRHTNIYSRLRARALGFRRSALGPRKADLNARLYVTLKPYVEADPQVRLIESRARVPSPLRLAMAPRARSGQADQKSNCTLNFAKRGVSTEFGRSHVFTAWLGTKAAL